MSFIAQIRLDELAKTALPKRGLLSFFVAEEEESYLEKASVLLVDTAKLEATALPEDFGRLSDGEITKKGYKARSVTFSLENKLPPASNPVLRKTRWAAGEKERYEELIDASI